MRSSLAALRQRRPRGPRRKRAGAGGAAARVSCAHPQMGPGRFAHAQQGRRPIERGYRGTPTARGRRRRRVNDLPRQGPCAKISGEDK
jgi:hypothetical protein